MTSLLPSSARTSRTARPAVREPRPPRRRPLVLLATLGGALAAGGPLLVCLAVGVVGWFLTDSGVHGEPHDGMRTGALAWLTAHGSGLSVRGAAVTVVPLGLTLLCAWSVWRVAHRVGDAVSSHGPDADRIADGERDLTVPAATAMFGLAYGMVAVLTWSLAAGAAVTSVGGVLRWVLLLTAFVAGPALAIASGRAAIWATLVPPVVRHGLAAALSVLGWFTLVSAAVFVVAFLAHLDDAATMLSELHTGPGEATLYALVNAAFGPNAALLTGSYLLGPGFAVGAGTLVAPGLVVLGPLPLLPLVAALPAAGAATGLSSAVLALPPVVAAAAVVRTQRRRPTLRWDEGALRGCGGGIVAGVLLSVLVALAGGAAGPGRMRFVGAVPSDVLVHAVTSLGLGGLVGGLLATSWQRHAAKRLADDDA